MSCTRRSGSLLLLLRNLLLLLLSLQESVRSDANHCYPHPTEAHQEPERGALRIEEEIAETDDEACLQLADDLVGHGRCLAQQAIGGQVHCNSQTAAPGYPEAILLAPKFVLEKTIAGQQQPALDPWAADIKEQSRPHANDRLRYGHRVRDLHGRESPC